MMKILWTEKASADALGIFDYIAEQSLSYADTVYERILARPLQLTEHPHSGSVVPEFGRDDIRELFIYSFRLIYRVADTEVRVLTVIHGNRKLTSAMIGEA
ncbi:MAG: type II toxin-antitoxin system RelE/ParE family toxin [Planctomycetota bacterium]